jgi:hypothetical protein
MRVGYRYWLLHNDVRPASCLMAYWGAGRQQRLAVFSMDRRRQVETWYDSEHSEPLGQPPLLPTQPTTVRKQHICAPLFITTKRRQACSHHWALSSVIIPCSHFHKTNTDTRNKTDFSLPRHTTNSWHLAELITVRPLFPLLQKWHDITKCMASSPHVPVCDCLPN